MTRMTQTKLRGMDRVVRRSPLYSDEEMRQAMRAWRTSKAPFRDAQRNERHAQRLLRLVEKGHTVDDAKIRENLQEREREYQQCRAMIQGLEEQRNTLVTSARRLEGAMLALRTLLGSDAPPVPEDLRPSGAEPGVEDPSEPIQ